MLVVKPIHTENKTPKDKTHKDIKTPKDIKWDDRKLVRVPIRSTCVSARDVGVLLGISPFQTQLDGLFEKCGYRKWRPFTQSMRRGVEQESEAIDKYIEHKQISHEQIKYPGFNRHPKYNYIGGVPDAIYTPEGKEDILIEIKCPEKFSRGTKPPIFYVSQIQIYLQIFNIKIGHYVE